MWCVQVRRSGWCNVYVECADPAVAREAGLALADDFDLTETVVSYEMSRPPNERFWRGGEDGAWVYPETTLFEGNET